MDISKFKIIGDRILVAPDLGSETTKSGLIIPDLVRLNRLNNPDRIASIGKVVGIGTDSQLRDLRVSDRVIFARYSGQAQQYNDESVLVLSRYDIFATVHDSTIIRPLRDQILVKPIADDEITSGGVIIPEKAQAKPQRGRVLALGSGQLTGDVEIGDIIIYQRFSGIDVALNDKNYIILAPYDIFGVEIQD